MLQFQEIRKINKEQTYSDFVRNYLPEINLANAVEQSKQESVLKALNNQIEKEQFYFITDVKTGEISFAKGIFNWLGYEDQHFSKKKFLSCILAHHTIPLYYYVKTIQEMILNTKIKFNFRKQICIFGLALKHADGRILYCINKCTPYDLTSDKKVLSYINEFSIVKEYAGEGFHFRFCNTIENHSSLNEFIYEDVKTKFENSKSYSIQEIRIMNRYAKNQKINSESIAKAFKIKKNTVDTYNKRILKKTEIVFGKKMENARHVAEYLSKIKLI